MSKIETTPQLSLWYGTLGNFRVALFSRISWILLTCEIRSCKNIFGEIIELPFSRNFSNAKISWYNYGIICYNWKSIKAFANARFKYSLILCYTCIYYTFMYSTLASTHEMWNCEPDLIKQHAIHNVFPFTFVTCSINNYNKLYFLLGWSLLRTW